MDVFKHFLAGVMNVTLREPYLILDDPVSASPTLWDCVKVIQGIKYEDGNYHNYFGEVKNTVGSFVSFWTDSMDEELKVADKIKNTTMNKESLQAYIQNSIDKRANAFKEFENEFLPIESPEQQQIYDDILKKHNADTVTLYEQKDRVLKFEKQVHIDTFIQAEIQKSLNVKSEVFQFTHIYISMLMADHLAEIEGSLKDIVQRLRKNIATVEEESSQEFHALLLRLYEKNQQELTFNRMEDRPSAEAAEIRQSIEIMRRRVSEYGYQPPMVRLRDEERFFSDRLKEFQQIADTLRKVKAELEVVEREYNIYKSMSSTELPGWKLSTWETMGRRYEKRSKTVKDNLINTAKALLTFICVRGPSRAVHVDSVGHYYVDEQGHQVYNFQSGLRRCHVDCERNFKEKENEACYYYDNISRYHYSEGEKLYQVQGCASSYKLGEDTVLKKVTIDCGHSEAEKKECGMRVKDLSVGVILPKTEPVDIASTLDPEVTGYLWDVVGSILPDALHDVGVLQPKNPIHYLAHRLLAHKYGQTKAELRRKKKEADVYRANILRGRKEEAIAEARAWKATLAPRRKPEESDDAGQWAAYNAHQATQDLIRSINFYD